MGYEPALSAGVSSPGSTGQQFDYSSAIDPALEAVVPPTTKGSNQFQQSQTGMPNFREDLKRELQSASPYSSGASDSPHLRGGASFLISPSNSQFSQQEDDSSAYSSSPAKGRTTTIDDLLALGGPVPPPVPGKSQEPDFLEELKHLYHSIYSPGLESFLESKWFSIKGIAKLLSDNQLLEQFAILINEFGKTMAGDDRGMAYTSSVEARVVWSLACMVRTAGLESSNGTKSETGMPAADDMVEAGNRLTVVENLLRGVVADRNVLAKPPGSGDAHRLRELGFWYTLGKFVTLDLASSAHEMEETLNQLRALLDGRENRDVLYSIAVVRAMSNRVAEYSEHDRPLHLDETDQRSKLAVAKQFVKDEGDGSGTTNVIRRLCEMATRSWSISGLMK